MSAKKGFISRVFRNRTEKDGNQAADTPSGGQRAREAAIILLEFGSIISEATDLLKPMKVVCGFLKKVLEVAKSVEKVDKDWSSLIRTIRLHIATVESQTNSLEEDESIDESPPPLGLDVEKSLQDYISKLNTICEQLNTVYQQWHENGPNALSHMKRAVDVDHNKGVITQAASDLDKAFQVYTMSLERFVAGRVDQIQQELAQFHREFEQEVKSTHLDRLENANLYGNPHRQCLQGTRLKTLDAIRQWANNETTTTPIFCLLDVAGSGKSTVAKHMVDEWNEKEWLVGRFFFSRDTTETMSTGLFCSTVSDAFASLDEDFKDHVAKFKERPDRGLLSFEDQFEGLIASPLRALNRRAILTIDALDECDNTHGARDDLLETLCDKQRSIPMLRTFITGRPERDIKQWAEKVDGIHIANLHSLEGENQDVENYIRFRLQGMPDIQDRVIRGAEGLFIWARIACDLLVETDDIEGLLGELEGHLGGDSGLAAIYRVSLEQAIPRDKPSQIAVLKVLQMILAARRPLSIAELDKISPWSGRDGVARVVTSLGSLLLYQDREDPIRLLHITLREFLTTRTRAGNYFIQPRLGHYTLALGSLEFLTNQSSSDINQLDKISKRKGNSFNEVFINFASRTFHYASSSWAHHCATSYRKLALTEPIREFVNNSLKTWINLAGIRDCFNGIRDILLLSHRNMYPRATEAMLDLSLEQVRPVLPGTDTIFTPVT